MDNISGTLLDVTASLATDADDMAHVSVSFLVDDAATAEEIAALITQIGQRFALIVL
jgi:hypothetical protein